MNTLKSLFIIAILGAIAYGAYISITRKQQLNTPQADASMFPGTSPSGPPQLAMAAAPKFPSQPPIQGDGSRVGVVPDFVAGPPAAIGGSTAASPFTLPSASVAVQGSPASPAWPGQNEALPQATSPGVSPPSAASQPTPLPKTTGKEPAETLLQAAEKELDAGRYAQAHLALSNLRHNPDMPPAQAARVTELLDQLAGYIIYSREHLLERPYTVQLDETLEQIATRYNVPWQLLANINGIRDPQRLEPGKQLKVVRGPFNAVIHLDRHELTLMLSGRYAGRFPIGVGRDYANLEGAYVVSNKTVNPQYYGPDGTQIDANHRDNPLGEYWIGLTHPSGHNSRLGIHGTNDPTNLHTTSGRGSIRLSDKDIKDIFGIFSVGPVASRVTIMR